MGILDWFFYLSLLVVFCFYLFHSVFFSASVLLKRYDYAKIPTCRELTEYRKELSVYGKEIELYNLNNEEKLHVNSVQDELDEYITTVMGDAIDINEALNKERMDTVKKSMLKLWISLVGFIVFSGYFILADLDLTSPRKSILIEDARLGEIMIQIHKQLYLINNS
ncbi:hypothetical protein ACXHVK_003236 [Morganella morganii]|nr:hypothetical protein [Morganella morganii]